MRAARFEAAGSGESLLPLADVLRLTGHCRTAAYTSMMAGLLPRPVKIGRASRWPEDEVLAVRAALLRGDDDSSRRALVRQLQANRGASGPVRATYLRAL
jgi:prophage regulatory protein